MVVVVYGQELAVLMELSVSMIARIDIFDITCQIVAFFLGVFAKSDYTIPITIILKHDLIPKWKGHKFKDWLNEMIIVFAWLFGKVDYLQLFLRFHSGASHVFFHVKRYLPQVLNFLADQFLLLHFHFYRLLALVFIVAARLFARSLSDLSFVFGGEIPCAHTQQILFKIIQITSHRAEPVEILLKFLVDIKYCSIHSHSNMIPNCLNVRRPLFDADIFVLYMDVLAVM